MVSATLEKPGKISFDSLRDLREELTKQSKNQERLHEFQNTIDEALKDGDKRGVIEFTENEWKNLITEENLLPIEDLMTALKGKIEAIQEVTAETKEKTGGIAEEIKEKVEEVKNGVTEKIDKTKEKITSGIAETLSPIEKIKNSFGAMKDKIGGFFGGIETALRFTWYTLLATLGFKAGKEGLALLAKDKAEKVVAEGKEKLGEIAEKAAEKASETKETIGEKLGPLAVLAGAGTGILAIIGSKLPPSLRDTLGRLSGTDLLKKIATSRALRLFGIGGVSLFGIGKLSEYIENNGASLGEIPTDEAGKKTWWKNAIEKAGIGIKDGAQEIWAIVNGEKLDEYLSDREDEKEMEKRGYVTLENHPTIIGAKRELGIFEKQCEVFFNENRQAFNGAATASVILKPGIILKGAGVALSILSFASPNTVIPAGIILALIGNSFEGIKHIQIPVDFGPEDIQDILAIPDIKAFLETQVPGVTDTIHFDTVAKEFQTLEQKIKEFNTKSFWEKIAGSAAEKIIESPQEKINSANEVGYKTLVSSLELLERENDTQGAYKKLLGDEKEPGILKNLITKLGAGNALTEGDIRALMEATEGTNIRIFPRGNTKSGTTIQWQTVDENGTIKGLPRNICVNPTLEYTEQFEVARDFLVDEYSLNAMNVGGKVYGEGKKILSDLVEGLKNNSEKSGNLVEKLLRNGFSFLTYGLETFAVDYLGNKYFLGPWNLVQSAILDLENPEGKLEMQEGLIEYGQSIAPIFLITATKNLLTGHGLHGMKNRGWRNALFKNSLIQSVIYPVEIIGKIGINGGKGVWKGGKYIIERAFAGNYKDIFSDPKNEIKAYYYSIAHRLKSLKSTIPLDTLREIGGKHANLSKLEEARKLLYKAKQSYIRSGDIGEAIKILEDGPGKFEHLTVGGTLSNPQIKTLLDRVEKEIEEQKKTISYLENGVRQHFPQELTNRTANIDSLKGFDITTEQGKKDAEKMLLDSQAEIENMEKERLRIEKEHTDAKVAFDNNPNDTNLKQDFDTKQKAHLDMINTYHEKHRNLSEIREAMGELLHGRKPKIRIGESHVKSVKGLRGSAKILGILALTVGAGVAIEKIAGAIHGDTNEEKDTTEFSGEDDEKYFGFRKDVNGEAETNKEKNEFSCETPEEFNRRIEVIETQYTESISKFFEPDFVNNLSSDEREKKIQEAADGHILRVDMMKSLIRENKDMMEAFWNKKFTNEETGEEIVPEDIREQGVKAFMFIHKKDGKLMLDYMNHQDMKNVFYILYDASHQSLLEQGLGEKGGMATDLALRVAPFTGSFMDGKDAFEHFSRGNTIDGVWSTAWCLGGLALDVGGFFSFGGTAAAGTALRTTKAGIKIAKTAGGALLHNGVQLGVQFGTSLAKVPRSESINIDDL